MVRLIRAARLSLNWHSSALSPAPQGESRQEGLDRAPRPPGYQRAHTHTHSHSHTHTLPFFPFGIGGKCVCVCVRVCVCVCPCGCDLWASDSASVCVCVCLFDGLYWELACHEIALYCEGPRVRLILQAATLLSSGWLAGGRPLLVVSARGRASTFHTAQRPGRRRRAASLVGPAPCFDH